MENNELYHRLGLTATASKAEIKAAYRLRAKDCHPDKFRAAPADIQAAKKEVFERLAEARDILMDDESRRLYDQTGTIEKTVDRTTQEALSEITRTFRDVVAQAKNPERIDVLAAVREVLIAPGREEAVAEIKDGERSLKKLRKMVGKVRRLSPGDNFLERATENLIRDAEAEIEGGRKKLALVDRIEQILGDFTHDWDDPLRDYMGERPTTTTTARLTSTRLLTTHDRAARAAAAQAAQEHGAAGVGD